MNEISEQQKRLLQRAVRLRDMDEGARFVVQAMRQVPAEELLDPQWADIWDRVKRTVHRYLPTSIVNEVDKRLETVQRIDEELQSIRLGQEAKVVFLLGAGASAPEPSGIPTVMELLPELWRRARKIGREDLDALSDWCNERGISNIEDLLTAAYIANFVAKNANVTGLLNYFLFRRRDEGGERDFFNSFEPGSPRRRLQPPADAASIALFQDTLQTLFGLLTSTMISAKPNTAHEAIVKFMQKRPLSTVVTTNYDGCIDEAMSAASLPFNVSAEGVAIDRNEQPTLVKMHGSINWAFCESCQDIRVFDLRQLKELFEHDDASYAVIGVCTKCSGQRRPLLVPPLSFKSLLFPNLVGLWQMARRKIEEADWLIVVGFSFSDAETYITKTIARSLMLKSSQRTVVCDTNAELAPNLRTRFSALIDGFDPKRVLRAANSCEIILPQLLETFTAEAGKTKLESAVAVEGVTSPAR